MVIRTFGIWNLRGAELGLSVIEIMGDCLG
jgi:hypothetical protein